MQRIHARANAVPARVNRLLWRWMAGLTVAVILVSHLAQAVAQTGAANAARGSIVINGKATEFRHAYAFAGKTLSDQKRETTLIVTDKPLSPKAVTDKFARMREARTNAVQHLEFSFDENNKLTSLMFGVEPMGGGGFSSSYRIDVEALTDNAFKGRAYVDEEREMFGNRFKFDIRFDAAFIVARAPDATGAAAWATPQGKVIAEYLRAARAGNMAALKRVVVPERAGELDGPNGKTILSFLKDSPDPKSADFDSLVVEGDTAEAKITTRTKTGATSSNMRLQQVKGVWMVSP